MQQMTFWGKVALIAIAIAALALMTWGVFALMYETKQNFEAMTPEQFTFSPGDTDGGHDFTCRDVGKGAYVVATPAIPTTWRMSYLFNLNTQNVELIAFANELDNAKTLREGEEYLVPGVKCKDARHERLLVAN